jgi:hypothetical protein
MDDQSLWKKESSFGREPNNQNDGDDSNASDEQSTSLWKKELSFEREPKADAVEGDVGADLANDEPIAQEPVVEEPSVEEPVFAEPEGTEETVWKREISFGARASSHDQPVEAEPVLTEATATPEGVSEPHPEPEPEVWTKEVSFSRTPDVEPVGTQSVDEVPVAEEEPSVVEPAVAEEPIAVEEQVAEEPLATETLASVEVEAELWNAPEAIAAPEAVSEPDPEPEPEVWTKEVSFSRTPEVEPAGTQSVDEVPVAEEPIAVEEQVAEERLAT